MSRLLLYLILLAGLFDPLSEAQQPKQLRFDLFSKGEKIGEIIASRSISGNDILYKASTRMSVRFVLKQDIFYQVTATFRNGILTGSEGDVYLNKKLHSTCRALWETGKYQVRKDDEVSGILRQITYSGAMLYFHEPPVSGKVFSELNGYDNNIRKTAAHQYLLTDAHTKKESSYFYKNGVLESASIDHALVSIELRRAY